MWYFCRIVEEKREMVKCIKEVIKWSIKVGYNLVNVIVLRLLSFWCNNVDDKFNVLDLGFFLCFISD